MSGTQVFGVDLWLGHLAQAGKMAVTQPVPFRRGWAHREVHR